MNPELIQTYQASNYFINGISTPLRVGEVVDFEILNKFSRENKLYTLTFITAHNPGSVEATHEDNLLHSKALIQQVEEMGLDYVYGFSEDPTGKWPKEDSIAILNLSQDRANKIARLFHQSAYLWLMRDKPAELILL